MGKNEKKKISFLSISWRDEVKNMTQIPSHVLVKLEEIFQDCCGVIASLF